jgi:hypothetical protein
MKLHTYILVIFTLALPLHAQSLIPKTDAQVIAERIDSQQIELLNHVESQLRQFHAAVNTEGKDHLRQQPPQVDQQEMDQAQTHLSIFTFPTMPAEALRVFLFI